MPICGFSLSSCSIGRPDDWQYAFAPYIRESGQKPADDGRRTTDVVVKIICRLFGIGALLTHNNRRCAASGERYSRSALPDASLLVIPLAQNLMFEKPDPVNHRHEKSGRPAKQDDAISALDRSDQPPRF